MSNIPQYDAGKLDLRPTETGIDALQQSARRVGAFYSQAANDQKEIGARLGSAIKTAGEVVVDRATQAETISGAKNFAAMFANKTQAWNDIASQTPPDRMGIAAEQFRQSLEPDFDKYAGSFNTEGGQKFAQAHINSLRQHLYEKTAADTYHAAGEAAKVDTAQTVNQLASGARLDPSSLDFALKTAESTFEHMISASGLTGDLATRFRTEGLQQAKVGIVKSAVLGMIERNPDVDLTAIQNKYSGLISGAEMQQFVKAAKVQAKTDLLRDKQLETYAKQQADLKVHTDATKNLSKNVTIDPTTNRPIINPQYFKDALDIAKNNPDAPSAASTTRTLLDWGEHQQNLKETPRTDQATKADLMTRMFDPDKPTTKIDVLRAEADGKLATHDGAVLREMITEQDAAPHRGPVYQSAIEAMKERVGYGLLVDGHERFANAMQQFWPEYNRQLRAGTLPANALDLRDPKSLISQSIARFEPDAQTRMMAHTLKNIGLKSLDEMGGVKIPGPGGGNLTGPSTTITGTEVRNAPPFNPPKTWQYSPSRDQYRDPATGKMYDRAGKEVK